MDPITGFFADLYEWIGLNPLYSKDLSQHLRGFDITCTDYIATHWYSVIGFTMLGIVVFFYLTQYHFLDKLRLNKRYHWWIFAFLLFALNWLIGFIIPYRALQSGDYCQQLIFSLTDCIGFGFTNASWSFVLYALLTSFRYPRKLANNCRHTTFWKP